MDITRVYQKARELRDRLKKGCNTTEERRLLALLATNAHAKNELKSEDVQQ
jgi:hypothetical protein